MDYQERNRKKEEKELAAIEALERSKAC